MGDETQGEPALGRTGRALLLATVFASGTAVMIVEMTAVRAVQPAFGSTTYVWTNVIAVVLLALAVGYALGGRLADRHPSPRLLFALLGVGGLLAALAALLATPVSRLFLQDGVDLEGVVSVMLWGSLGTALVLFAPPVLVLGMVAPLAIRLLARGGVGRAAGSVFALSTAGSILGTYLPTLLLVPHLGSRGSFLVAAAILLLASAAGLLVFTRRRAAAGLPLLLLLAAAASLTAALARLVPPGRPAPPLEGGVATVLEETESPYQYLTVRDDRYADGVDRVLTINEGLYTFHALRVEGRLLTGVSQYDAYAVLPLLLDLEPGSAFEACVVGMACGVNARQWHELYAGVYDVHVDGAELDPEVVRLGRRFFDLPADDAQWLDVFTMDGRTLLEHLPAARRYHAIVVDAFANELYVPFHLATREFLALCERRLEDGGLLAMNVYARGEDAPNLRAIENTMATVFGEALRIPHQDRSGFLLLARRGGEPADLDRLAPWTLRTRWAETPLPEDLIALADGIGIAGGRVVLPSPDERVLTDDHAPLTWLTDRFLWSAEEERFAAGDARSEALRALRDRQNRLLLLIAAGWALLLLAAGLALRRANGRRRVRAGLGGP